jgi:hypothetical protein
LERFTALYARECPEYGDGSLAVRHLHFGHTVSILLVEVDDPL